MAKNVKRKADKESRLFQLDLPRDLEDKVDKLLAASNVKLSKSAAISWAAREGIQKLGDILIDKKAA